MLCGVVLQNTCFMEGMGVQVFVFGSYFSPLLRTVLVSSMPPITKRWPSERTKNGVNLLLITKTRLGLPYMRIVGAINYSLAAMKTALCISMCICNSKTVWIQYQPAASTPCPIRPMLIGSSSIHSWRFGSQSGHMQRIMADGFLVLNRNQITGRQLWSVLLVFISDTLAPSLTSSAVYVSPEHPFNFTYLSRVSSITMCSISRSTTHYSQFFPFLSLIHSLLADI